MDLADLAMILEGVDKDPISCNHPSFIDAADNVKKLQGLDNDTQLQLYGLYKQSTVGDVNTSKPWSIDMVGSAKWNSWKSFQGFPKESAARAYVYVVSNLLPRPCKNSGGVSGSSSSGNGSSSSSRSSNSAFAGSVFDGMGVSISTPRAFQEQESAKSAQPWKESESLFAAVHENDVDKAVQILNAPDCDVNMRNSTGMTPLHYAVDRGNVAMVQALLKFNADINAQDSDNQTPLVIAKICDYDEIIKVLTEADGGDDGRDL